MSAGLAHALLISLLLPFALAGTMTTDNCPKDFDATVSNVTVSASIKPLVNLLFGSIYSASDQAAIQNAISSGQTGPVVTYATSMQILFPFILIAIVFAITFIIAMCCCVFEKSCPPCQSWKRDFERDPYQKNELRCAMLFSVLFAGGICLTALIGFVFFPDLENYITMTKCSMYYALDVAINGDQTNSWGGFGQLHTQIGNVTSLLADASNYINGNLTGNDWLLTGMTNLQQMNLDLYKNNNMSTVYSPNPVTTANATTNNNPLPTIVPLFIQSGLGPNGTNGTMVYDIDKGLQVTAKVSDQGYKTYKAAFLLASSANNISANAAIVLQSLSLNARYLDAVSASVSVFSANIFDKVFNWGLYLIQGVLGFVVAASFLVLMGVFATHSCQLFNCKNSVHLGWIVYGFTYFGIVVICFLFLALGGVSYTFCQFYGGIVSNKSQFLSYAQASGSSEFNRLFEKLNVCFYGDGDIMKQFTINQEMSTVSSLFTQIGTFLAMRDSTKAQYVDTNTSLNKITSWITIMDKYMTGIYKDSSLNTLQNPVVALAGLNTYTNNNTGGNPPCCTNDYWVFDKTNCTYNSSEAIYVSSTTTSGTTFATGHTCISFNEKFNSAATSIWTMSDIVSRYVQVRQCGPNANTTCYSNIIDHMASLINYRDSRINLYQNLKDQLTALKTANSFFNDQLTTFTTKLNSFYGAAANLNSLVTNQINGLDSSSNCTTVANALRFVYNSFCVNFLYKSAQFGICCVVLLGIMIGGMLSGSIFGVRYGRLEVEMKRKGQMGKEELHSQTLEKGEENSSDSSSSSDD